jgi:hypothetical protein
MIERQRLFRNRNRIEITVNVRIRRKNRRLHFTKIPVVKKLPRTPQQFRAKTQIFCPSSMHDDLSAIFVLFVCAFVLLCSDLGNGGQAFFMLFAVKLLAHTTAGQKCPLSESTMPSLTFFA